MYELIKDPCLGTELILRRTGLAPSVRQRGIDRGLQSIQADLRSLLCPHHNAEP